MSAKPIINGLLILVMAVILISMVLTAIPKATYGRSSRVHSDIGSLTTALKSYQSEYGVLPTGGNSNVVKVLSGDNPKKIPFLVYRRAIEHPDEMLDPWQSPYQFQFLQQSNFIITSAGKDKKFSNGDDIIFNSVSNDFVKP